MKLAYRIKAAKRCVCRLGYHPHPQARPRTRARTDSHRASQTPLVDYENEDEKQFSIVSNHPWAMPSLLRKIIFATLAPDTEASLRYRL